MAKSMKADYSDQTENALTRRNLYLSNLLSFGFTSYTRTIKKIATQEEEMELQLDAEIDDRGRVKDISIHH